MTSMQLQIIRSGGQVLRETYGHGPVTFGREGDNEIIFTETYVSRHHGAFHQQDDTWYLENLSPNGTFVNGKRVRKKPVLLRAGDMITVGDQQIFHIEALLQGGQPGTGAGVGGGGGAGSITGAGSSSGGEVTSGGTPGASPISPASRKMKLWISLAIFWLVVLGILAFVQPLMTNKSDTGLGDRTPALTWDQISEYVRRKPQDIRGHVQPDERRKNDALAQARDLSSRLDATVDAPYRAYRAYQRAIAYSGKNILDNSQDMREYTQLETNLIRQVNDRYYNAYGLLRTHNFRGAEKAFRDLIRFFPEPENPLIRNVQAQRRNIGSKLRHS